MISWIVLIVSGVLLIFAVGSGAKTYSWVKGAQSVEGTVVGHVEKTKKKKKGGTRMTYAPRVQYQLEGEIREFVSSQSSNPPQFREGERVRVAVNLKEGEESIASFGELYGFSVMGSCIGAAIMVGMAIIMNGDKVLRIIHPNI